MAMSRLGIANFFLGYIHSLYYVDTICQLCTLSFCQVFIFFIFFPGDALHSAVLAIATCLSVRPSHAGIVLKWLNISLNFWTIRQPHNSSFWTLKPIPKSKGSPVIGGTKYTREGGKICNFLLKSPFTGKRCEIGPQLIWNVNRKSQVADGTVSVPKTFNDP